MSVESIPATRRDASSRQSELMTRILMTKYKQVCVQSVDSYKSPHSPL
jgi:hypothetical protein